MGRWVVKKWQKMRYVICEWPFLKRHNHQTNLEQKIVGIMGLKRALLFVTLLSSICFANVENSEPKIKISHYPWVTLPCSILVLALATFLNLSIINYIKDRSPVSLTILLMLYKESFSFILVSSHSKIHT